MAQRLSTEDLPKGLGLIQHPKGGSQTSLVQFQGIQCPLLVSIGTRHECDAQTYIQTKHPYALNRQTDRQTNFKENEQEDAPEEWHPRLTSGLHMNVHTSTQTNTHMQPYPDQHTK